MFFFFHSPAKKKILSITRAVTAKVTITVKFIFSFDFQGTWGKRDSFSDPSSSDMSTETSSLLPQEKDSLDPYLAELAFILTHFPENSYDTEDSLDPRSRIGEEDPIEDLKAKRSSSSPRQPSGKIQTGGWIKRPDGRLVLSPRSVNWSSLRGEN